MTGDSSVSIIIPAWDGHVSGVMQRLKEQSISCREPIVVKGIAPAARARNLGAQKAQGTYLVFIDDDVKFNTAEVLSEVVGTLKSLEAKDAITLMWRLTSDANWLQRALWSDPVYPFDKQAHHVPISWKECDAACLAVRAEWFAELGGFDEGLISGEDCDLAYRITKRGGTVYTLPHCWTDHNPPRTIRGSIKKTFWYEQGNAQLARKNPEADYRINLDRPWKAILYILLRTVAFFPLIFLKVNYRQRRPTLAFRPIDTFLSYMGAWAYTKEWLFPSSPLKQERCSLRAEIKNGEANVT